jgi:ribonuclease Z
MDVVPSFELIFHTLEDGFRGELSHIQGCTVTAQMLEHRISSFGFRVQELPHVNVDADKIKHFGLESDSRIGIIKREGSVVLENGDIITLADIAAPPKPQRSFVYCGDTRVCEATVELARGASVLLHEATFDASMTQQAAERYHCTSREAAEQAQKAEIERLFITHFSVRYKSAVPLVREARKVFRQTFMAKELCREIV